MEYWFTNTIYVHIDTAGKALSVTRYYPLYGNKLSYSGSVYVHHDGTETDINRAIRLGSKHIADAKKQGDLVVAHGMDTPTGRLATPNAIKTHPQPHILRESLRDW